MCHLLIEVFLAVWLVAFLVVTLTQTFLADATPATHNQHVSRGREQKGDETALQKKAELTEAGGKRQRRERKQRTRGGRSVGVK